MTARVGPKLCERERVQVAEPAVDDHEHVLGRLDEPYETVGSDPPVLLGLALMDGGPPTDRQFRVLAELRLYVGDIRIRGRDQLGPRRRDGHHDLGAVERSDERVRADERQRLADDLEQVDTVVGDDVGDVDRSGCTVHRQRVRAPAMPRRSASGVHGERSSHSATHIPTTRPGWPNTLFEFSPTF